MFSIVFFKLSVQELFVIFFKNVRRVHLLYFDLSQSPLLSYQIFFVILLCCGCVWNIPCAFFVYYYIILIFFLL